MISSALSPFHRLIQKWFTENLGTPTEVQAKAWPEIVRGRHVLVTAPTGCGKTLAAFLWGIHQLVAGAWPPGNVRILYVSPLKSLNNDVRQNLLTPLAGLKETFAREAEPFPAISVMTRSGDTRGEERRRMIRRPPEILITTPESLNILLTSRSGRTLFTGIRTVIVDEIHSIAGTKRGTHLITAVDRLVLLSGEFQRIALSATAHPAGLVADLIGGFRQAGRGAESAYRKRSVSIVHSRESKAYDIRVAVPSAPASELSSTEGEGQMERVREDSRWPSLINAFRKIISEHRSTLLFSNSRRTAEKVARMINEGESGTIAYAHHGSLSREIRLEVEQKLKKGELRSIVATNSLELGIDIGSLDRVVLIQTPRTVSSAVQRIGRSGHSVGDRSRATIFPTHGRDFIEAAVIARAVAGQDIEELRPVETPLDVLAQVILSMTAAERWDIDDLYAFVRTSYPFRNLARRHYDLLIQMLGGGYAGTRLRELKARVSLDRIDNTVEARSEVPLLLYASGGTIPERGYFDLRLKANRAKIGELDEEFVWERSVGETFTLGSQLWRIEAITHNDVEVVPVQAARGIFPFWRAEEQSRDFHLSDRIGSFLEHAERILESPEFRKELIELHFMEEHAADELIRFLYLQKEATGRPLPHRRHVLLEHIEDADGRHEERQVIVHTGWGGRVNKPFALALTQAWEEKEGGQLRIVEDDDALLLQLPRSFRSADLLGLLSPDNIETWLRKRLEQSGFFGARFRENAERALLLPKPNVRRRMPLWLIRQRAKQLLAAVHSLEDFPILLETWRNCLEDEFDLVNLKMLLEELQEGRIRVSETVTGAASPFARGLVWKQTNRYMYEDDTPLLARQSSLRPDLVREVLFSSRLRPRIPADLIRVLDEKLKRTAFGYAPGSARELLDWIKDRHAIPEPEWRELASAIRRDHDRDASEWLRQNAEKTAWAAWPGVRHRLLISLETLPKVLIAFRLLLDDVSLEPADSETGEESLESSATAFLHGGRALPGEEYDLPAFLTEWLSFYGPVEKETVTQLLGITTERLEEAAEPLIEAGSLVMDSFREESRRPGLCDSGNLETLLRMARRYRRPSFTPLPVETLPIFLAAFQGLAPPGESTGDLRQRLEQLFGWPARTGAWEEEILPARIKDYKSERLDGLIQASDLVWFGCGERCVSLAFREDLDLFRPQRLQKAEERELEQLFPDRRGRYSLLEIAEFAHMDTGHASELLWAEAWKGNVTSDTFGSVRKGSLTGFRPETAGGEFRLASRRSGFNRWKVSRPFEGNWLRIDAAAGRKRDILEEEELDRERVRQLLRRYGILFRELLGNEPRHLQWKSLFRAMRLMEFSGEVLSGYFFDGIPGPQFASHEAFQMLRDPLPEHAVFRMNATDPASLCGTAPGSMLRLPSRLPSTHLVFCGRRLVMISRRLGRSVEIRSTPEDPLLHEYFRLFQDLLNREYNPARRITIETINGDAVLRSPYAPSLKQFGFRPGRGILEMWKEFS